MLHHPFARLGVNDESKLFAFLIHQTQHSILELICRTNFWPFDGPFDIKPSLKILATAFTDKWAALIDPLACRLSWSYQVEFPSLVVRFPTKCSSAPSKDQKVHFSVPVWVVTRSRTSQVVCWLMFRLEHQRYLRGWQIIVNAPPCTIWSVLISPLLQYSGMRRRSLVQFTRTKSKSAGPALLLPRYAIKDKYWRLIDSIIKNHHIHFIYHHLLANSRRGTSNINFY